MVAQIVRIQYVAVVHCLEDNSYVVLWLHGQSFWALCVHYSFYCCLSKPGAIYSAVWIAFNLTTIHNFVHVLSTVGRADIHSSNLRAASAMSTSA
jgi:hypothetical protein